MRLAAALMVALFAAPSALAQDGLEEIRSAWAACTALLDPARDDWTGWRRNFDGGYADHSSSTRAATPRSSSRPG